jgi:hypothetical protein
VMMDAEEGIGMGVSGCLSVHLSAVGMHVATYGCPGLYA